MWSDLSNKYSSWKYPFFRLLKTPTSLLSSSPKLPTPNIDINGERKAAKSRLKYLFRQNINAASNNAHNNAIKTK